MLKNKLNKLIECDIDLINDPIVHILKDLLYEQELLINELKYENFQLKKYRENNKENELKEFLIDLLNSCDLIRIKDYSKEEVILNLLNYIKTFAKDNKIKLT